ncbi:MAG: MerR family transcriptional regulator, partial [Actinobacteria bacterium]|nr:MerR family transcriptional regulator [Actinomycetota bacterium]
MQSALPRYRIGELARRAGVTTDLLRAWERRYALLRPCRSPGGFRLYSEEDAARVARMRENLATGMSAAEAAAVALAVNFEESGDGIAAPALDGQARRLRRALDRLDEDEAQSALDVLIGSLTLDTVLRDVVIPY